MPRRKPVELHVNHERWLVSYADFITLLFAFFVVMYSVSQVSENKHRQLSETLMEAFSPRSMQPIQVGEVSRAPATSVIELPLDHVAGEGDQLGDGFDGLEQLSEIFSEEFGSLIDDRLIQVHSNEFWLQIEVQDSILFGSASAEPSVEAQQIFSQIAAILKDRDNPIQVEGHTDNVPISSARFPSNWELSAARAAAMVKLLERDGVAAERLSAVGYGEHQPAASNDTPIGRAQNRRVALMIARAKIERPSASVESRLAPAEAERRPSIQELPTEAPDGSEALIEAIELEDGDLLFSSDPDLPRDRSR
ncbi:flagellar motor protein MotD [Marinimicrobium sp. ABcell2]|uniref:flagellar motor protein MotD n=1 Tax=Marinimicrobium sp. ABcell2 TaxID=3069751 RepID=UPI0027B16EA2|nr:flagellar motor protein MotD [Marinimicrobium sp. ABcell2]MDQ2078071.1 flagellar motor protein MotD [Marinimicrobium sp. ABcell2]